MYRIDKWINDIESLTAWKLLAWSLHIYLISTVRKLADEPPHPVWVSLVWEWPPMELRAERGRWVSEIRSNIGRRRAGEVSTIHYAASWSVSKTIYRPLTRGKHWLSRHPHRVTCRRQTKYFSSPLALPRNIVAAACPELGVRYLHPDIALSSHQFSRNENSLSWFLRKQKAFKVKVAGAGGGWNRKMVSVSVNWQNVSLAGCGMWRVFY